MLIALLPIFVAVILPRTQGYESDTTLLLVQILSRHAERAPNILYPTDPNPVSYWPEGLGKLTTLGKEQAFALGTCFSEMYTDFITTSPNEITVNSSNVDRCVKSALATVASFYNPSPKWAFRNDIKWQPIPVYSVPETKDLYLSGQIPCPRMKRELEKVFHEQMQILLEDHKEMIDKLSHLSGKRMDNVLTLSLFQDTLEIESRHGLKIPSWAEHYWFELKSAVKPIIIWFSQSPVVRRLLIGPLLGRIVEDMKEKSAGGIPNIKVRLYSSHDIHIANMLEALKVFNKMRIPFSASVVFELHKKTDGEKVVRLLYLNSTTPENPSSQVPHTLILDGCSEYCPLAYFVKIAEDIVPVDWKAECKLDFSRFKDDL